MKRAFFFVIMLVYLSKEGHAQTLVKNIAPQSGLSGLDNTFHIIEYHDKAYFNATDQVNGHELWVTDGTTAGTYMLKDINPTPGIGSIIFDGIYEEWHPIIVNDLMIFPAFTSETAAELWVSDGTADGTHILKEINLIPIDNALPSTSYPGGTYFKNFLIYNNECYFTAYDGVTGTALWKTDGTYDGTVPIMVLTSSLTPVNSSSFTLHNGIFYFTLNGKQLWSSDGTPEGTALLQTFEQIGSDYESNEMVSMGNALYFAANNGSTGMELWKYENELFEYFDIIPGIDAIYPRQMVNMNDQLYFVAYLPEYGDELWVSDGTQNNTMMLKDINPVGSAYINFPQNAYAPLFVWDNAIWFSALLEEEGKELWKSDGTAEGTVFVAGANDGSASGNPDHFVVMDNVLYYSAFYGSEWYQLFRLEAGSMTPEVLFENGYNDNACCSADMRVVLGDLYFNGNYDYNDEIRTELYRLNAIPDGVEEITADLRIYPNPTNGILYIQGFQGGTVDLYQMDGKHVFSLQLNSNSVDLRALPSGIYQGRFVTHDGVFGQFRCIRE